MKTKILTLLLLLSAAVVSAETMRVAILEPVDRENKVSYATKLMLRSNLAKAVTNTADYEAYDRSDMDAIIGEQNFQRTGMVSEDQIKRLGEMTGAKYILVAEAAIVDAQNMFITAKVLDVETARTMMTDNLLMGMDAKKIQEGCAMLATKLFSTTQTTKLAFTKRQDSICTNNSNKPIMLIKNSKESIKYDGISAYSYGDIQMSRKELGNFLYHNCPIAYQQYKNGRNLKIAGGTCLGTGLACIVIGLAICDWDALSIYIPCVGAGLVSCSIPILCIGNKRINHSHEIFNQQCATQENLTLNLQASQNGLGLALNF